MSEDERARASQLYARGRGLSRSQLPHERDEGRRMMKEAKQIHKSLKPDRGRDTSRQMSRADYDGLASKLNSGGGFSVRAFGNNPGQIAADAYMVGGMHAPEGHLSAPVQGEAIESYANENRSKLSGRNRYLGGWGTELDVSQAFPRGDRTLDEHGVPSRENLQALLGATYSGILAGQDAIGEVDERGDYEGDILTGHAMAAPAYLPAPSHVPASERQVDEDLSYRSPQNLAQRNARQ